LCHRYYFPNPQNGLFSVPAPLFGLRAGSSAGFFSFHANFFPENNVNKDETARFPGHTILT
jgi:hypothetical protein